jgi:hypothetical protein
MEELLKLHEGIEGVLKSEIEAPTFSGLELNERREIKLDWHPEKGNIRFGSVIKTPKGYGALAKLEFSMTPEEFEKLNSKIKKLADKHGNVAWHIQKEGESVRSTMNVPVSLEGILEPPREGTKPANNVRANRIREAYQKMLAERKGN